MEKFEIVDVASAIDKLCIDMQKVYPISPSNDKNVYLRACWLLAKYNKIVRILKLSNKPIPENILENAKVIKQYLSELKKAVERKAI